VVAGILVAEVVTMTLSRQDLAKLINVSHKATVLRFLRRHPELRQFEIRTRRGETVYYAYEDGIVAAIRGILEGRHGYSEGDVKGQRKLLNHIA